MASVPREAEQRVTPLELFFDLVFVFALTQVTTFLADDPTWGGLLRGLMILGVVWWSWVGFAWLTNALDTGEGWPRLILLVAMAAMLIASLCVPGAFDDEAALFALSIAVVRGAYIAAYARARDAELWAAVTRMGPSFAIAMGLLLLASALDGTAQTLCWALALLVDYTAPLVSGTSGWHVHPAHFAERHGLVVIIALGESIVAIGVGAEGLDIDALLVLTAVLGLAVAGALWWAYFDVAAIVAERRLRQASGAARAAMARDSFSYLHFVLVAGIVLFALGVKTALGHAEDPLEIVPAVALCGGPALFLAGHVLFRLRNTGTVNRPRLVAVALLAALVPLATEAAAVWALIGVAAVCVGVVVYGAMRFAEARRRVQAAA